MENNKIKMGRSREILAAYSNLELTKLVFTEYDKLVKLVDIITRAGMDLNDHTGDLNKSAIYWQRYFREELYSFYVSGKQEFDASNTQKY
jgi:hypothetical protein